MSQGSIQIALLQIALILAIVVAITPRLGDYMAQVFMGNKTLLDPVFNPLEKILYQGAGITLENSMAAGAYLRAILWTNLVMGCGVFGLLMAQGYLPLNPTQLPSPPWDTILHTTIAFLTNTDQQHYSGELTLSYGSQILGLGFLSFTSAATGLAVAIAFARGISGQPLGNFYGDFIRAITRILLPLSLMGAIILLAAGTPETLAPPLVIPTLEDPSWQQAIARGPIAHLESIKLLGENGGGFFAANSAHPLENPNSLTNTLQIIAMMVIPSSLIYTYGVIIKNRQQAWLIYGMVLIFFVALLSVALLGEYHGNPLVNDLLGGDGGSHLPNLEGKEVRFGWAGSTLYGVTSTATMTGAVNSLHDSFMPLGLWVLFCNLFLQIIWGGQGTGTAYLFTYLILSVFITGLMVGRTPEFLGRKIEKQEVILTSFLILLVHPIFILIPSAITLAFPESLAGITNPGFHGLSQVIYEYASAVANNGSGLEGLLDSQPSPTGLWWNLSTSLGILAGRYLPITALILFADGLGRKQPVPPSPATLRTDTPLFIGVTALVIVILGVLTFFPVLALGPIAEALQLAQLAQGR
jgi:potassium-transporting ATPase potassium-binding subunit